MSAMLFLADTNELLLSMTSLPLPVQEEVVAWRLLWVMLGVMEAEPG